MSKRSMMPQMHNRQAWEACANTDDRRRRRDRRHDGRAAAAPEATSLLGKPLVSAPQPEPHWHLYNGRRAQALEIFAAIVETNTREWPASDT